MSGHRYTRDGLGSGAPFRRNCAHQPGFVVEESDESRKKFPEKSLWCSVGVCSTTGCRCWESGDGHQNFQVTVLWTGRVNVNFE